MLACHNACLRAGGGVTLKSPRTSAALHDKEVHMTTDTKPTAPETQAKTYQMLIDGQWVNAKSGKTFERLSPANGELVGTYPLAGTEGAAPPPHRAPRGARRSRSTCRTPSG